MLGVLSALLAAVVILTAPGRAIADGPFGVAMGSDPASYPDCRAPEGKQHVYRCQKLPRMHPGLVTYSLFYHSTTGICRVRAGSPAIKNDRFGNGVRQLLAAISEQIAMTYGPPTVQVDAIVGKAVWNEPQHWTMSIFKNERTYGHLWDPRRGYTPRNNVENIAIAVRSLTDDTALVAVDFTFANHVECRKAFKAEAAEAF